MNYEPIDSMACLLLYMLHGSTSEGLPIVSVLIVDDDIESLQALATTLLTVGITNLRTVSDSTAVPTMLDRETFSLVLLDLNMPGLSGTIY